MARLTSGQKAERVLKLLLSLRNARIAAILVSHGLTNEDLAGGWELLRATTRTSLDDVPRESAPPVEPQAHAIPALEAWQNKWFTISKVTLERRAPAALRWLSGSVTPGAGAKVILAVDSFVQRWEQLDKPKGQGGLGPAGKEAKKILHARGLTPEVINEAKKLLTLLAALPAPEDTTGTPSFADAEEALWAWYLEWSGIARTVIKDRRLLKVLGFRKGGGGDGDEQQNGEEEDAAKPPKPAPVTKPKKKGKVG